MNIYLVFIVSIIYCVSSFCKEIFVIRNCCPEGQFLVRNTLKLRDQDKYDCLQYENLLTSRIENESSNINEVITGYRIINPNSTNTHVFFENCETIKILQIPNEHGIRLPPNSCLAMFDNKMSALTCVSRRWNSEPTLPLLRILRKCCPVDSVYDSVMKHCVPGSVNYSIFNSIFDHPIIFLNENVECPKSKVLVEYKINRRNLKYNAGSITIYQTDEIFKYKSNEYCIEALDSTNINFLLRTCNEVSICEKFSCVRKCCEDGELFVKGNATSYCKKDFNSSVFNSFESLRINANFTKPEVFGILRSLDCLKFRLDPDSYPDEAHFIDHTTGMLKVNATGKTYLNKQYCLEKVHPAYHSDQKLYTFLCFDSKVVGNDRIRFKLYPIGLLISCCFYLITLIVYLSISKLRNLPGQILICLVSSLLVAYLGIALGQLMPTKNDNICFISGFFIYFCLMAAFSWMNVTCFDIWQTFGSTRTKRCFNEENRKRFLVYSAYGWGLPTFLTTITILLTKLNILNEGIRPIFGHGRCWFTYDTIGSASLLFFSGPIGILFFINFVLFTLTLTYCNKVKREIFRMQSSNAEKPVLRRRFFIDKARFAMNTKLFIVMGITWLLELLSILFYDHKKTFFWAISDSFNVLLGVFVFKIFVFKKRVWLSILEVCGKNTKHNGRTTRYATCATHSTVIHQNRSMIPLNSFDSVLKTTIPKTTAP